VAKIKDIEYTHAERLGVGEHFVVPAHPGWSGQCRQTSCFYYYSAVGGERSIVMSVSVCFCVHLCVWMQDLWPLGAVVKFAALSS